MQRGKEIKQRKCQDVLMQMQVIQMVLLVSDVVVIVIVAAFYCMTLMICAGCFDRKDHAGRHIEQHA